MRMNNRNEKTVRDEKDEAQLSDLGLADEELDNVKGGRTGSEDGGGGMGGDWVINHNETTVSDDEDEAQFTDLRLTDEKLDVIKGGPSGTPLPSCGIWIKDNLNPPHKAP